jgi:isopentenyl phosphate kinase
MKIPILLIKLGGSIVTNKHIPYSARIETIHALAKVLKSINSPLIISHGSGSFGHTSASIYGGKHGYKNHWGLAKVARDAMEINRIIMDIFIEEKLPVISFRPISCITSKDGKISQSFFEPIYQALLQEFIPVVYGDVIFDKSWKTTIFSGETILSYLIPYLFKRKILIQSIIQVSNYNGIHDVNGKTIPLITNKNWGVIKQDIFPSKVPDVTGGMNHKIETALKMTKLGIKTIIINGTNPSNLLKVIQGEKLGTTISQTLCHPRVGRDPD